MSPHTPHHQPDRRQNESAVKQTDPQVAPLRIDGNFTDRPRGGRNGRRRHEIARWSRLRPTCGQKYLRPPAL
jgi:hypothetical protein